MRGNIPSGSKNSQVEGPVAGAIGPIGPERSW